MKNRRLGMWLVVMNIPLWGTGFAMRAGERLESNAVEAGMDAYRIGDATLAFERFKEACIGGDATGCVNLSYGRAWTGDGHRTTMGVAVLSRSVRTGQCDRL